MNKGELVKAIASQMGIPHTNAEAVVGAFVSTVTRALQSGEKVTLSGFGTFSVAHRAARKARNPRTGAEVMVQAAKVPKFKAGTSLKQAVN